MANSNKNVISTMSGNTLISTLLSLRSTDEKSNALSLSRYHYLSIYLNSGGSEVIRCVLLDKIVDFGTHIVEILLYRNFDGSMLARPYFGCHLGFQNGRHLGPIFSNISRRKTIRQLITNSIFHERNHLLLFRLT